MDICGVKATVSIKKDDPVVTVCGELLTPADANKALVNFQRVLIPGQLLVDSHGDINSRGGHVPDGFTVKGYNVRLDVNRPTTPDCLIGYATRNIKKDEFLFTPRGRDYWRQRAAYEGLEEAEQAQCKQRYKIKAADIVD